MLKEFGMNSKINCKICNHENKPIFHTMILNKCAIKYYHCYNCKFLQTEEPSWTEEFYMQSINISDIGYTQRNILLFKKLTILLTLFFDKCEIFRFWRKLSSF